MALDTKYNRKFKYYSRHLRKNMTKEERKLWYEFLKPYPVQFYRQKIIGKYIADFYCAKARLVIELDGSQHYNTIEAMMNDIKRTNYIEQFGISVIRVPNKAINENFRGVCETLDVYIKHDIEKHNITETQLKE